LPQPKRITDMILQTVMAKGADAAVAEYREMRGKYYGRDVFDFSETELLNLAMRLADIRPDDAIALARMNLEFNPQSAASYRVTSRAFVRKRDFDAAIAELRKGLEIDPGSGVIRGTLEQLEDDRRRRERR